MRRLLALIAGLLCGSLLIAATPAGAVVRPAGRAGWSPGKRWATADDWEPNVAASARSPWVYQMTTRYGRPSICPRHMDHCVVFRASADRGRTWGRTVPMPRKFCPPGRRCRLATAQNDPVLLVSTAGVIYAAWMNNWDVVFMRSADHGRTWHDLADFRRAAGLSFTDKPWLAISPSGRDVYQAFNASNSYVAASHDYGRTWSRPVRTNADHRYWFAEGGAVAPDGTVYFAESAEHQDERGDIDLAVVSSADHGAHWRTAVVGVSQQQPSCRYKDCPHDFYGPQVSVAAGRDGTVLAAYAANQAADAPLRLYVISSADGKHWTAPRPLTSGGTVGANFPKVAAGRAPGSFYVAWQDDRNGPDRWNLRASRTRDDGATWTPPARVSGPGRGTPWRRPAGYRFPYGDYFGISVDGAGTAYLIWSEGASYDGPGSTWWSKDAA